MPGDEKEKVGPEGKDMAVSPYLILITSIVLLLAVSKKKTQIDETCLNLKFLFFKFHLIFVLFFTVI